MEQANAVDEAALREQFLERLMRFVTDARAWLAVDPRVAIADRRYRVEDPLGKYDAPGLEISIEGQRLASIVPVAGVVIGAEGRLDVKGPLDQTAVLYLSGPGRTQATVNGVATFTQELFRGFVGPGWYWMLNASSPGREVRRVDANAFKAMVEAVSDYELSIQR